jgi:hypothetical protein
MSTSTSAPIRLAGSSLGAYRHVCAFFDSTDDEYRALLPFTKDGIARSERVVHVMPMERTDHVERLRGSGIDVEGAVANHQLDLLRSEDTYMVSGAFDPDVMLSLLRSILAAGRTLGFSLTRIVAHAEHVFQDLGDAESFIEYESRLNFLLRRYQDPIICTYDLSKISAGAAMAVLRTHPMVIMGGVLQENPFFVPPDVFLREMDEKHVRATPPSLTVVRT